MKRESIISAVQAFFLSFFIAAAGLGCLSTAFGIYVSDWGVIALWCAGFSLIAACLFSFRWGGLILTALMLAVLNTLLRHTQLLLSAEALICHITRLYHSGYHWGYIRWSQEDLSFVSMDSALIFLGCLIICAVTWTLLRKKWLGFGLLGGLLPLLLCCILLDTVPHWLPLLILVCSLFILILSHRARKFNAPHGNILALRLLIPVVLFCSLIFAAAPTVSYEEPAAFLLQTVLDFINELQDPVDGTGGSVNSGSDITGTVTAEDLDLRQIGPLELDKQRIMVVSSNYPGKLYLRARAYDTYTGTDWKVTAHTENEGGWPIVDDLSTQLAGNSITIFTINTESFRYIPYYIRSNNWTAQLQSGMLANPDGLRQYTLPQISITGSSQFTPLSAEEEALYLSLPDATREAATSIAQQILAPISSDTVEVQVLAIANYVKNSAAYDLNTAAIPEDETDFALWFLENGETGYCVHFATAATVLLRAAGIPARYVSGYMAYQAESGNTSITADQAHAWVEYLDPSNGWTVLEATPGMDEEPDPTEPTQTTDPTETEPTEEPTEAPTEEATQPPQTEPFKETEPTDPTQTEPNQSGTVSHWNWEWVKPLLVILLAAGLLAGQYKLRLSLRRRWFTRGEPNRQAVRRWKYVRRLARLTRQKLPKQLHQLTEKAVFSQHAVTDAELALYDVWIRNTHQGLLDKKQPLRLLLRLLLAI